VNRIGAYYHINELITHEKKHVLAIVGDENYSVISKGTKLKLVSKVLVWFPRAENKVML